MDTIVATQDQVDAAQAEEQRQVDLAIRNHLQQRVVLLNIENQALRARVAELEDAVSDADSRRDVELGG